MVVPAWSGSQPKTMGPLLHLVQLVFRHMKGSLAVLATATGFGSYAATALWRETIIKSYILNTEKAALEKLSL